MAKEGFDYIIVGAGTAGCLLANRLSADRNKRVLLIEAGGNDANLLIKMPAAAAIAARDNRCARLVARPASESFSSFESVRWEVFE